MAHRYVFALGFLAFLLVFPSTALARGDTGKGLKGNKTSYKGNLTKAQRTHAHSTFFTILGVRVEPANSAPDWKFTQTPVSSVKGGTAVYVSTYVNVASAPASAKATLVVVGLLGTQVMYNHTYVYTLPSNPAGEFRLYATYVGHSPGKRNITVKLSIAGSSQVSASTSFTVT